MGSLTDRARNFRNAAAGFTDILAGTSSREARRSGRLDEARFQKDLAKAALAVGELRGREDLSGLLPLPQEVGPEANLDPRDQLAIALRTGGSGADFKSGIQGLGDFQDSLTRRAALQNLQGAGEAPGTGINLGDAAAIDPKIISNLLRVGPQNQTDFSKQLVNEARTNKVNQEIQGLLGTQPLDQQLLGKKVEATGALTKQRNAQADLAFSRAATDLALRVPKLQKLQEELRTSKAGKATSGDAKVSTFRAVLEQVNPKDLTGQRILPADEAIARTIELLQQFGLPNLVPTAEEIANAGGLEETAARKTSVRIPQTIKDPTHGELLPTGEGKFFPIQKFVDTANQLPLDELKSNRELLIQKARENSGDIAAAAVEQRLDNIIAGKGRR